MEECACRTRAADDGVLSMLSSSSCLLDHQSSTCCLENPKNHHNRCVWTHAPLPEWRIGCGESTIRLDFGRSMEWCYWFFEQETQSLSFGGRSGGSHPLGCMKARGGDGAVRRRPRLSVPLYLTRPWLRTREETEGCDGGRAEKIAFGEGLGF